MMERALNIRWLLVLGFGFLFGFTSIAFAQKGEASVNYSLVVYNPAKSLAGDRNLNGGGGSIGFNLGDYLTVKGEFQGYSTSTFT